jgi:RND family efflux transporter MFP subunit
MKKRYRHASILMLIGTALFFFASACSSKPASGQNQKEPGGKRKALLYPVQVQPVSTETVVYSVAAVGSVEAFETVMVTARVAGVVEQVRFSEGKSVNRGDVLVEIEPLRYRLAVESAEANFKKAQASEADALAALKRREAVVTLNPGLIPGEEIETWRTRVATTRADVEFARASLNQARLNLSDALVKAPLAGIIQTRTVQTGQYLQPGTVMATLVRRDPLLIRFHVTEADAPRLVLKQEVLFRLINDSRRYSARISHIAASADPSTRMVQVTAEVDDPHNKALRPGTFAEIDIAVSSRPLAPVIPQTAVRPSEKGFLAYVIRDGKAFERILKLGMRSSDGRVEVLEGIESGENLVIRGSEALTDGCSVRVEEPGKDAMKNPTDRRD